VTGLLLVDKPEGGSSAGVIRTLKPLLGGAKVGHLGTLDPFASGLLPLCIGEATKVARHLLLEDKAYTGVIRLGVETDTLDRTGRVVATAPVPEDVAARLPAVASAFLGRQRQIPPMYSALKRSGTPLYALARRGVEVEREAREIEITRLDVEAGGPERIAFAVDCSKGTYVRVLAADLGRALGTVAHLEALRRTGVGRFRVDQALSPEALAALAELPLIPVRQALAGLRAFDLEGEALAGLRRGQQGVLRDLPPPGPDEAAVVLDPAGNVTALLDAGPTGWRLARLLLV
jgi:tRNA pseudouridine55 synthase